MGVANSVISTLESKMIRNNMMMMMMMMISEFTWIFGKLCR